MQSILIVVFLTAVLAQVPLREVQVLTLNQGTYTTGRRSTPISQLRCVGGDAMAEGSRVTSMQCHNQGFDGRDINWKCEAKVPNNMKLGRVTVNCEGYEFPEDPKILIGSCGVEFELLYLGTQDNRWMVYLKLCAIVVLSVLILILILDMIFDPYKRRRGQVYYPSFWSYFLWSPISTRRRRFSICDSDDELGYDDSSFACTERR
jgi:hypothetical protein